MGMQQFIRDLFGMPFWQNLVAGIMGGLVVFVVGIPAGLAVNRRAQRGEARQRQLMVLKAIEKCLENTTFALRSIRSTREPMSLDTAALDSTAAVKYEVLQSVYLAGRIDEVRHRLYDIDRQIGVWREMRMRVAGLGEPETVTLAKEDVLRQVEMSYSEVESTLKHVKDELRRVLAEDRRSAKRARALMLWLTRTISRAQDERKRRAGTAAPAS